MKNVIITGSSRGIGFELVKLFNENDYKVIALSRNTKPICNLKLKNVHSHYLDISSSASINKTIKLIFKEFKKIDILINNAGTLINKPFNETSFEDFQYVYKVNVFGVAELIRQLISRFKTKSHVVNISSIGGVIGSSKFPGLAAYSASKGALNILTEVLAEEYKESGPKFNSLSLGSVNTPMLKKAFPGYEAQVNPNEMASYIYNFANTGSKLFNGKVIPISSSTP